MKLLTQKGFTLIELIVVIVIIGILAAIAIPRFQDLSTQAKIAACIENQAAVQSACSIYYSNGAISGNAQYPDNLYATGQINNATYFSSQVTPTCPVGPTANYTISAAGDVSCPNGCGA